MNPQIITELSILLLITLVVTGLLKIFKQPVVIGYIFSGIIAGPAVLNIIDSQDTLSAFSHIGVAFLLFLVGLNLNPKVIKEVGKIALVTGFGQVIFTSVVGFLIAKALGFETLTAIYIAIALTFSSTIIIMKLLSDKQDLQTLYGRISVGFLIVQDFIAIILLLIISSLNAGVDLSVLAFETVIFGLLAIVALFVFTQKILPKITKFIAKSQELLLLFSISWCFFLAAIFHQLNFSIEAGALLAGISLSMSPYHLEISSKMKSLRDFFLILFFILLGSQMIFTNILGQIPAILLFSAFVLIGNPLIVVILMGLFGYTKRNSFLAGLTVAQISEFSLILITMGVGVGHLSNKVLSVVTAVGLVTFAGSTYMILYSHKLYPKLSKFLGFFEKKGRKVDSHKYHSDEAHDIILFGANRIGYDVIESLKKLQNKFLIIDYNPNTISDLSKQGYNCRYGDAGDTELLNELYFDKAKMIISTVDNVDTNLLLINKIRDENKSAVISVVAHQIEDAERLYEEGATYVIMPHFLGAKHFSTMIEKHKLSPEKFLEEQIVHIEHIKKRKRLGHEHPRKHH